MYEEKIKDQQQYIADLRSGEVSVNNVHLSFC